MEDREATVTGSNGRLGAIPVPRGDRAMDALLWLCPEYLPARSTHADGGLNSPTGPAAHFW